MGYTRRRKYDKLGIQIAGLDYRLHNSVDLLTKEQSLDVVVIIINYHPNINYGSSNYGYLS